MNEFNYSAEYAMRIHRVMNGDTDLIPRPESFDEMVTLAAYLICDAEDLLAFERTRRRGVNDEQVDAIDEEAEREVRSIINLYGTLVRYATREEDFGVPMPDALRNVTGKTTATEVSLPGVHLDLSPFVYDAMIRDMDE